MTAASIDFEWDAQKAETNFAKHRIDFDTATDVFDDPHAVIEEDRDSVFEFRARITGWSRLGVLIVVFTERRDDIVRLISARRANRGERRTYMGALP